MENKKKALVIGALGGLGSATVEILCDHSWHVFAADVREELLQKYAADDSVSPILIDLCDKESIHKAYESVSSETSGLDAIINMAGILQVGSMIELPLEALEKTLQINLVGVYQVNQQFFPLLMAKKGRIINLSSEVGRQTAAPFNGLYSISKHALEAYSDALRRELSFLGIKVIKIQPGPFKTQMTQNAEQLFLEAESQSHYFKKNLAKGLPYLPKVYNNAKNPQLVAKIILQALTTKSPKTAYAINMDRTRTILEYFPVKWVDVLIKKVLS